MDKVRVLKWELYDNPHNIAEAYTMIDNYWIHPKDGQFLACIDDEVLVSIGAFDTAAAAMDACEADYIERCSEFLRVAGPGQVVVQAEDLTRIVTWFRGDARTVPHADMDATLGRFKAAIDAAGGEK